MPAFAQDRFWFFSGGWANAIVTQVDVTDGGRTWTTTGKWTIAAGYPLSASVPVVGGRYLVWLAPATPESLERTVLAYLDTRTGQNGAIPAFLFGGSSEQPSIAADRQSGRLFVLDRSGLWVLNSRDGTLKLIPIPRAVAETRRVQAAGGRAIATLNIGASTTITIPNVPRGTYYVRVRAINDLGVSAPSTDVRIDVP